MKLTKQQTETYVLTELESLDPVFVYVTNYGQAAATGSNHGKMVIECYGQAWAHYWGGMGEETLQQFVLSAHNSYLAGKLIHGDTMQTDFDEISKQARENGHDIIANSDVEVAMMSHEMAECFGGDWFMDLPRCSTPEYDYLCRILDAVKTAFQLEVEQQGGRDA